MSKVNEPVMQATLSGLYHDFGVTSPRYWCMVALKVFAEHWVGLLCSESTTFTTTPMPTVRMDWLREAAMCAIELGQPLNPSTILRLLSDRQYFETLCPVPQDSPEWGGASGTEIMRQWWALCSAEYREQHLQYFRAAILDGLSDLQAQKLLAVHPGSGNRGFTTEQRLS